MSVKSAISPAKSAPALKTPIAALATMASTSKPAHACLATHSARHATLRYARPQDAPRPNTSAPPASEADTTFNMTMRNRRQKKDFAKRAKQKRETRTARHARKMAVAGARSA